jgi:tetratricopeptide (TPR) repeat protein
VRASLLLLLLLTACKTPPVESAPQSLIGDADEAGTRSDWAAARTALERASLDYPHDPVLALRLARIDLEAYGDVDRAQERYERLPREYRAHALHGLGRCALWRGDEERALAFFRDSLASRPTAPCARDLALRLLARAEAADEALDLVESTSGDTLRSKLLLAAAGRLPVPHELPEGWTYALERARLKPLPDARPEVDVYLDRACATPEARAAMDRVFQGDPALCRNPARAPAVRVR